MNRLLERRARDLWEAFRHTRVLEGQILDAVSGDSSPTVNPAAAESAFPVEDQDGLDGR